MSSYINSSTKLFKAVLTGIAITVVSAALLMCLTALIMNLLPTVPYGVIDYAVTAALGISVLIGAFFAALIAKSRGLIIGLICAASAFVLNLALSLCAGGADIGLLTAVKAAVMIICGILGGILGVNKKEKIRIH